MRRYLQILAFVLLFSQLVWADSQRAALFVPGDTPFWQRFVAFSTAAATDLDLDLSIYYAELDRNKMLEQVRQVCEDGIEVMLFVNYEGVGQSILEVADRTSTPAFLVNTAFENVSLYPRVYSKNWIGELTADDHQAGLVLAERLMHAARKKGHQAFHILAYRGRFTELSHVRRFDGLNEIANARDDVTLATVVAWDEYIDHPAVTFSDALKKHPEINIVWSVSDLIPAKIAKFNSENNRASNIVIGGIDWQTGSLDAIGKGHMDIDLGGHVFDGARAVVLVFDYLNGRDFAEEGLSFNSDFVAVNSSNYSQMHSLLADPGKINYRLLSKSHNAERTHYEFDLNTIAKATRQRVVLTQDQRQWLADHPSVRFTGDPNWLPYEAFDQQGNHSGIVAQILDLLEQHIDIQFKRRPSGTWPEALRMAAEKEVEVISGDLADEAIQRTHRFTAPYLEHPLAIVMRQEQRDFVPDLHTLANKDIAIIKHYGYTWDLFDAYPNIEFVEVDNVQEGLKGVSTSTLDAFVSTFNLASYHINQLGLNNLRIVGQLPVVMRLGLAVSKDQPILYDILSEGIATLTPEDKFHITENWMQNKYVAPTDYGHWLRALSISGLVLLLFLVLLLIWNSQLKKQVRRRTASLQESQASLSKAQAIAHLGNWEWDLNTDAVRWSDEAFRLFGYQPGEIKPTGRYFERHVHPQDLETVSRSVKTLLAKHEPLDVIFRIYRKDREMRYIAVQAQPHTRFDKHRKKVRLFGIVQDRTEHFKAEHALRQSELRYRLFIEANTAGILNVQYRPSIRIDLPIEKQIELFQEYSYTIEINAVFARQLGYDSPEDCKDKNLGIHLDWSNTNNLKNLKSYVSSGYRVSGLILYGKDVNGKALYFLNNAHGIVEKGLLKETWLSLIDITPRLQAEQALCFSEEKFSKAFDSSPDAITIITLRDTCFKDVNKSFEHITGYSKHEVLDRTPLALNLLHEPNELDRICALVHGRSKSRDVRITFRTKSGTKRVGQVSGGVIDIEGEAYLVLVTRDMTEQMDLERKTRQQELQLIQVNKMTTLGTLISGVGHEINHPNGLILMNGQILYDAWPEISKALEYYYKNNLSWQIAGIPYEEISATLPDLIAGIKDAGQRIQNIVGSLRDFARPGRQAGTLEEYQINDAVQRALQLLKHVIENSTNHFHLRLAADLPLIMGDSQKIEQVIVNLVSNALESLPNSDCAISVTTRYSSPEKMVEIEVADEGIGLTQEVLEKIREPFYTTKSHTGGTGLGLAISDSLINEQGGYLSFLSEQGKGTQAIIHLPENLPGHVPDHPIVN